MGKNINSNVVSLSWEHAPGVRKVGEPLPPPPCPSLSPKIVGHALQIPLPPCPFQPPSRCPSGKDVAADPFLVAYIKCTESSRKDRVLYGRRKNEKKERIMDMFSCKHSCGVREDSMVSMAHVLAPVGRERGREIEGRRSLNR
ncbi:hypothetical protein ACLOJK_036054 [Asimina triloba]